MKTNIRQSVFETNSSSTHSISIAEEISMLMDTDLIPDETATIELTGGEFGWEWEKYNDAPTKANYAAVFSKNNPDWRELLSNVICKQTGAINVLFNNMEGSYIDHQSDAGEGGAAMEAFESEEKLRQFIFNKNSWLFTGNDNGTPDPTFYDVPIFINGRKILPKYRYEIKIDGYAKTTKFKEKPSESEIENALRALLEGVHLFDHGNGYYFNDDNSIAGQMLRMNTEDKAFKFGYECNITDEYVDFKRETWNDANRKYHEKFGHLNQDWSSVGYKKAKEIEEQLIKDYPEKYVRKVKYKITEL